MPRTGIYTRRRPTKKTRRRRPAKPSVQKVQVVAAPRRSLKTYNTNVGLPLTKRVKLTYCENQGFSPASGVASLYSWNLASINDPQVAVGGHRPMGWTEWSNFYKQYYVTSAKITIDWSNIATQNVPHNVFVILDKDNTVDPDMDHRNEKTRSSGSRVLLSNSNNTQRTVAYYSARKFFDLKDLKDQHQIHAVMTADPTLKAYAVMGVQAYDGVSTATSAIYGMVKIEYNVVLFDPIDLSGS